jgi:hypothetical protein
MAKRETDEELLARIKALREERTRHHEALKAVERKLRGAERSWGVRQQHAFEQAEAERCGFKTVKEWEADGRRRHEERMARHYGFETASAWRAWKKADARGKRLIKALQAMTVANGCTEAEARVAAEKFSRIKGR